MVRCCLAASCGWVRLGVSGWGGGAGVRVGRVGCGVVSAGVGVRRGKLGGVPFTQVSNALFRDGRISFKAKGLFGLIASHRSGWRVSVTALVGCGREGRDAVRAGLMELERFGYLCRERVRQADGTLGPVVYVITDQPAADGAGVPAESGSPPASPPSSPARPEPLSPGALPSRAASPPAEPAPAPLPPSPATLPSLSVPASSGLPGLLMSAGGSGELPDTPVLDVPVSGSPMSGFPTLADPVLGGTGGKNISNQKTKDRKKRKAPRPPGPACPEEEPSRGKPAPAAAASAGPAFGAVSPGVRLLERIGAASPPLRLSGMDLHAVGAAVDRLLEGGWSLQRVEHAIAARPLPRPVRTSVAAVIAARVRALSSPPGPGASPRPTTYRPGAPCPDASRLGLAAPSGASRRVARSGPPPAGGSAVPAGVRAVVECAGCGRPGTVAGSGLCPVCLDWPACRTCSGPTPRRADPAGDGRCSTCTQHSPHGGPGPGSRPGSGSGA